MDPAVEWVPRKKAPPWVERTANFAATMVVILLAILLCAPLVFLIRVVYTWALDL